MNMVRRNAHPMTNSVEAILVLGGLEKRETPVLRPFLSDKALGLKAC